MRKLESISSLVERFILGDIIVVIPFLQGLVIVCNPSLIIFNKRPIYRLEMLRFVQPGLAGVRLDVALKHCQENLLKVLVVLGILELCRKSVARFGIICYP